MTEAPNRWVSIDFGLVRIGLAVSDPTHLIASPLTTLIAEKKLEKTAKKLIDYLTDYSVNNKIAIGRIIIGLPLLLSGKQGFLADEVDHFVKFLKELTEIPIVLWDERLTSKQAERTLREGAMTRKKQSKVVDRLAAVIILQNYLDAKRFNQ